ncbi:MAG: AhpC/TSA family protein [Desulfovibrio sp.]|jgi:peroxiredoxin|nr:AhpC/TSA family protein [Desulfovibrio sp.]
MTKIVAGDKALNFTLNTPWNQDLDFFAETANKKTAVFFLRYFGCTTCQLEIHNIIKNHARFVDAGGTVYVVLQSEASTIIESRSPEDIPFVLILDAEQKLYKLYGIGSRAEGQAYTPAHIAKRTLALEQGFTHGKYEGNEQQLPAVFVIDEEHVVRFAHYGEEVSDIPAHEDILTILRSL